jgi:hypothetical protein
MAVVSGGAWTNERHEPQKKFARVGSNAPRTAADWATVPVDMGRRG